MRFSQLALCEGGLHRFPEVGENAPTSFGR